MRSRTQQKVKERDDLQALDGKIKVTMLNVRASGMEPDLMQQREYDRNETRILVLDDWINAFYAK